MSLKEARQHEKEDTALYGEGIESEMLPFQTPSVNKGQCCSIEELESVSQIVLQPPPRDVTKSSEQLSNNESGEEICGKVILSFHPCGIDSNHVAP